MAQDEDFFAGGQATGDDYIPSYDADSPNSNDDSGTVEHDGEQEGSSGQYQQFDPRRGPGVGLVMAEEGGEIVFNYFDQSVSKNWAGPEHWKLRRLVRKRRHFSYFAVSSVADTPCQAEAEAAPKPRREKKEAFKIDFSQPIEKDVKEIAKDLFAPPAKPSAIMLAGTASKKTAKGKKKSKDKEEKRDNQTLPDDMHFSSRQLVTLFLKPKFSVSVACPILNTAPLTCGRVVEDAGWPRTRRAGRPP